MKLNRGNTHLPRSHAHTFTSSQCAYVLPGLFSLAACSIFIKCCLPLYVLRTPLLYSLIRSVVLSFLVWLYLYHCAMCRAQQLNGWMNIPYPALYIFCFEPSNAHRQKGNSYPLNSSVHTMHFTMEYFLSIFCVFVFHVVVVVVRCRCM